MTNRDLKNIIEVFIEEKQMTIGEFASKAKINRPHLSSLMNSTEEKPVTKKMLDKISRKFPGLLKYDPKNEQKRQPDIDHFIPAETSIWELAQGQKFTVSDLLQEKEARRREAEERAKKAEETNERLLELLETNLGNLAKAAKENTGAILSEIRGYGQQQIRMLVQYNDEEFAKAKQDADKIYLLNLKMLLGDSKAGERKQDMHDKAEGT